MPSDVRAVSYRCWQSVTHTRGRISIVKVALQFSSCGDASEREEEATMKEEEEGDRCGDIVRILLQRDTRITAGDGI